MGIIIGGYESGLLNSSLTVLNRRDSTRLGPDPHGEQVFINIANGNLAIQQRDAYMPSRGEDYALVRTYNTRGKLDDAHQHDDAKWTLSTFVRLSWLHDANGAFFEVEYGDGSVFEYRYDAATDRYISTAGAGAYETIEDLRAPGDFDPSYRLIRADQSELIFDKLGRLLSVTDTNGVATTYEYASDRTVLVRDDQGHTLEYTFENGVLLQVADVDTGEVLVQYRYENSLLVEVIDRYGHSTQYFYNTQRLIERIVMPSTQVVDGQAQTYDTREILFEYEPIHWRGPDWGYSYILTKMTDSEGGITTFDYAFDFITAPPQNGKRPQKAAVDPNLNSRFYKGGKTTVVDALGNNRAYSNEAQYIEWRLANGFYELYDANQSSGAYLGQVEAIRSLHSLTYTYNADGYITEAIDQQGFTTTYTYDEKDNLTSVTDRNGHAAVASDSAYYRALRADLGYVDASGLGKLASQLSQAEKDAILARFTTYFTYDERGNTLSRTDNSGFTTTYAYTAFNKLASMTAAMGQALVTSDEQQYQDKRVELGFAALAGDLTAADQAALIELYTTHYSYDANQNLIEIVSPGGDITRFTYDVYGNLTSRIVYLDKNDLVDTAKQQVTQYIHDLYGNVVQTIDAEGNTSYAEYDHFGNLVRFVDGNQGITTYTYDKDNRLLTVTDPEGHVTYNYYDAVGNRIAVTDANGKTVTYLYDRNNMLIAVIDPSLTAPEQDRVTRYSYDVVGNRTSILDAEGRESTYTYDARRQLVEVTTPEVEDENGILRRYSTTYAYDGEGNRIQTTNNRGFTTDILYTSDGLIRRETNAEGHVTEFVYDANRNQVTITAGAQLAPALRQVIKFGYDSEDQLRAQTDAEGNTTRFDYDAPGNRVAVIDANGHQTDFEYDRNNRLVREIRPEVIDPQTGNPIRYTVTHQYDANGNEIETTDENGHVTKYTFDKDNRLVMVEDANGIKTVYTYDSRHNRTSVQIGVEAVADGDGHVTVTGTQNGQVTTYVYDAFSQLVAKTDGMGNALAESDSPLYQAMRLELGYSASVAGLSETDKQALRALHTEHYTYDRVGNYLSTTDNLGRTTSFRYDTLNRRIETTDTFGQLTTYRYDGNGNRVAMTDTLGRTTFAAYDSVDRMTDTVDALGVASTRVYDSFGNLVTDTRAVGTLDERSSHYEYDLNNRLTNRTDPEGHTEGYEYDAVGNRLRVIDGRGNATQYVYDALNRNIRVIDPLSFETRYEYDGVGNRLAIIDARGGVTRFDYDPGNRQIAMTDAEGRVTRYEYDVRGNRIVIRTGADTPDEEITQFEYDAENNLRAVLDAEGNTTTYDYDRVYNRVETVDGNGNRTAYSFDALNRNIEIVDALGGVTTYTYDAVGNRLTQTDPLGRLRSFTYDAKNRLIEEIGADGVATTYAYDSVDNRIALTRAAGTADAQTTTYVYDLDDRLRFQVDALGQTTEYRYDENHNLRFSIDPLGHTTEYVYDANNRVERIIDPLGNSTVYVYDGVGNRTQVIDALGNAQTTYYDLTGKVSLTVDAEGGMSAFEYDANGNRVVMTRYATRLAGPADSALEPTPVADPAQDQVTRYAYDKLNRLARMVDGEGAVVDTRYDAVGNVIATMAYATQITVDPGLPLSAQTPAADARDRLMSFAYDELNRMTSRVDAEGYRTEYEYDAVGNRLRETLYLSRTDFTDPALQQTRRYVYDQINQVVSETSPLGIETTYSYDARGNRTGMVIAANTAEARVWGYQYDVVDRLVEEVNPELTVTRHVYDAAGRMIEHIEAADTDEERVTYNDYDGNGRLIERRAPEGVVTQYVYDAVGNLAEQIDGATSPYARSTSYQYDRNNRLVLQTIAPGTADATAHAFAYDAFGNRSAQTMGAGSTTERATQYVYDRNNRMVAEINGEGVATIFDYDAYGNVARRAVTGAFADADGNLVVRTQAVSMTYDGRDLVVREENGAGDVIERTFDGAGNVVAQIMGGGTTDAVVTEYSYDIGNRLLAKVVDPSPGLGLTTSYTYDVHNNVVTETNARGFVLENRYDDMNRVVESRDTLGFSVTYTYDLFGNQTSITNGQYLVDPTDVAYDPVKAALARPATTRFAYDDQNRMTHQVDALGIVTRFAYDTRGNRIERIDAYGQLADSAPIEEGAIVPTDTTPRVNTYAYDLADRLEDETQPAGTVVHYDYNGAGEQAAKTVGYGSGSAFKNATTRFYYDGAGRLEFEVNPEGDVVYTEYDAAGNKMRVTEGLPLVGGEPQAPAGGVPGSRVVAYAYDGANRLVAEIVDPDGLQVKTQYEYDARGNQTAIIDANGNRGDSVFDNADRVIWQRDGEGNIREFHYDGRGNKTSETFYATPGESLGVGNTPSTSSADRTFTYTYDALDRLTERVDAKGIVNQLRYDAAGNVLEDVQNATGLYDAPARRTTYEYNLANLVTTQFDEASGVTTTFDYDDVYNVVRKSMTNTWLDTLAAGGPVMQTEEQVTEYGYDLNNRLTDEIMDPAGLNIHKAYRYDALGNRIADINPNAFAEIAANPGLTPAEQQAILNSYTTWTYFDGASRPRFTVDPLGHVKEAIHDRRGNLVKAVQYANTVDPTLLGDTARLEVVDTLPAVQTPGTVYVLRDAANDRSVEYAYDAANREVEVKLDAVRTYVNGGWIDDHRPTTSKVYDGVGNVVQEIDGNGNVTYRYYDSNGVMIGLIDAEGYLAVNEVDAYGNVTRELLYLDQVALTAEQKATLDVRSFVGGDVRVVEHAYDKANNRTETRYPSSDLYLDGVHTTEPLRVTRSFDAFGNLLTESLMHRFGDADPAFKSFVYDAAGRILSETDARGFTTSYAYDSANNMRERVEGDRVTTIEYDRANRAVAVHYPAADVTTVDANGNTSTTLGVRFVATMDYDAFGNVLRELKTDGNDVHYHYDRANRKIGAVERNNVYTEYGYNFAGDRTFARRYFTPTANPADAAPPAAHFADQVLRFEYDRIGRLVREIHDGDLGTATDDRVTQFGYDANGNQVEIIGARGHQSAIHYDGLNRRIGTTNPAGGLTATLYDAMGNVVEQQAGGWSAPSWTNDVLTQSLVSSQGFTLEWQTDRPAQGIVYVREQGTSAFVEAAREISYTTDHRISVSGLKTDTVYEYQIVAADPFGYAMTTGVQTIQTVAGIQGAVVDNVREVGGVHYADIHFSLPPGAAGVSVAVGEQLDTLSLGGEQLFAASLQPDGTYSATVSFADPATAAFQVRWSDGVHDYATEVSLIDQKQTLRVFEGQLQATPVSGGAYDFTVTWDLSSVLGDIATYTDEETGETRHVVYVGFALNDNQDPFYSQATLNADGKFEVTFSNVADAARKVYLYYDIADGRIQLSPIQVDSLVGLDETFQRVSLDFSGFDSGDGTLDFRYRLQGATGWSTLPASAVSGFSVDLLGLPEGDYEYEGDLVSGGNVLRTSSGTFSLREDGHVADLTDTAAPGIVDFTLTDNVFTLPDLLPLAANEALTLEITDSEGMTASYPFDDASFDLTLLAPGSYSLHVVKTRTVTTTTTDTNGQPITQTTTTILNDITGSITIDPRRLTAAEANALSGVRQLESFDLTGSVELDANVTTSGSSTTTDHIYSYYDDNGWKIFSNEQGGVWTRYFYDTYGNVTKEVRFKYQDPATGAFLEQITDPGARPSLAHLMQNYDAAVAAHNPAAGQDMIRLMEYTYDAGNNKLSESTFSSTYGTVTSEWTYDRFNNKLSEITFKGTGQQNELHYTYDAFNRVTSVSTGEFQYFDSNSTTPGHFGAATVTVTYDAYGNKSTETNERGYTKRFHYDDRGWLAKEWDPAMLSSGGSSALRTEYVYDAFGRAIEKHEFDLTRPTVAAHITYLDYDNFDQVVRIADPSGAITTRTYDKSGNQDSETSANGWAIISSDAQWAIDERFRLGYVVAPTVTETYYDEMGNPYEVTRQVDNYRGAYASELTDAQKAELLARYTEHFQYDGENRVTARTDRLGHTWSKVYDAYGELVSETDPNNRVTYYQNGAYGQVVGKTVTMHGSPHASWEEKTAGSYSDEYGTYYEIATEGAGYNVLEGASSYSETSQFDWLGRLDEISDTFGKHRLYTYDDGDRLREDRDVAKGQIASYTYDVQGNRLTETLTRTDGTVIRDQTNSYNSRGWLTGINGGLDISADGSSLNQTLDIVYRYDQMGNRVWVNGNKYTYDANNRMLFAYDGKHNETVSAIQYDGFGNRIGVTANGATTTYTYDAANRVTSSSAGHQWTYDANGNAVYQRDPDGSYSDTRFDAENRSIRIYSKPAGEDAQTLNLGYDAAGNLGVTHIRGKNFQIDEVSYRDVRYLEQSKRIHRDRVSRASISGTTIFQYDVNGNLVYLDRGRKKGNAQNSIATFTHDNDGHILTRSEKTGPAVDANYFQAYATDPEADYHYDEYGFSGSTWAQLLNAVGLDAGTASNKLKLYAYANGNPIAEGETTHNLNLVKLTLTDQSQPILGEPVYDEYGGYTQATLGYRATLTAADIVYDDAGNLDRTATARNLAERLYGGYLSLQSEPAQQRVIDYIAARLPANDADVIAGATIEVDGYLGVMDGQYVDTKLTTDYSYRRIDDGIPPGQAITHSVRGGETLQAIAQAYYGSPSYWYLIAGANGLSGSEELKEGTTLTVPNQVANSLNDKDTYKLYSESEIIGSTSPELKIKKKKRSFFQKLIQIVIIIIIVVVAYYLATYIGPEVFNFVSGALGSVVGVVAATVATAAVGYAIGVATSIVTQGLAVMAGLQDKFDWKAARDMGTSFAVTAVAGGIGNWAAANYGEWAQAAINVTTEFAAQYIRDGKVTSYAGLLLAMIPAPAKGEQAAKTGADATKTGAEAVKTTGEVGGSIARNLAETSNWWTHGLGLTLRNNRGTVGTVLNLVEQGSKRSLNTLDWMSAAASTLLNGVTNTPAAADAQGTNVSATVPARDASPFRYLSGGQIQWGAIARDALLLTIGGLVVGQRQGEDAAISFLGNQFGNTLTTVLGEVAAYDNLEANAQFLAADLAEQGVLTPDAYARLIGDKDRFAQFVDATATSQKPMDTVLAALLAAGPDSAEVVQETVVRRLAASTGYAGIGSASTGGSGEAGAVTPAAERERVARELPQYRSGEEVRLLQKELADHGYDPGPLDGIHGPRTQAALDAFVTDYTNATLDLVERYREWLDSPVDDPNAGLGVRQADFATDYDEDTVVLTRRDFLKTAEATGGPLGDFFDKVVNPWKEGLKDKLAAYGNQGKLEHVLGFAGFLALDLFVPDSPEGAYLQLMLGGLGGKGAATALARGVRGLSLDGLKEGVGAVRGKLGELMRNIVDDLGQGGSLGKQIGAVGPIDRKKIVGEFLEKARGDFLFLNKAGKFYPDIPDLRTGRSIRFPTGDLQRVAKANRVSWGAEDRAAFIKEWYDRGYPTPRGGWAEYDIHHIKPREFGGTNEFWNLTPVQRATHQQEFNLFWKDM